jgi:CBS-domain-containing membrane protein
MPCSEQLEQTLNNFMANNSREKHGTHSYNAQMFGLNEDELDSAFSDYRERFNITKNNR